MKCWNCKKENKKINNYCIFCGSPLSQDAIAKNNIKRVLQNAIEYNTDLIEVSAHECSCKYCANFQGKIFSISGKDKRYPKLPHEVIENGSFHKDCRHTFFPYIYGTSPVYSKKELNQIDKTAK